MKVSKTEKRKCSTQNLLLMLILVLVSFLSMFNFSALYIFTQQQRDDNPVNEESEAAITTPVVFTMEEAPTMKNRRTLKNIDQNHFLSKCPRNINETEFATTLVTQTTLDRLEHLERTCKRWSSPIISVVYIHNKDKDQKEWESKQAKFSDICPQLNLIPYISKDKPDEYPINKLRNIGLDAVMTSHVFMIDIDFIPSTNLDTEIKKSIEIAISEGTDRQKPAFARANERTRSHPLALVVPAYERKFEDKKCIKDPQTCLDAVKEDENFIPKTVESLRKCVNNEENKSYPESKCIVFHSDYLDIGHGVTKSDEWLSDMTTNELRSIRCIKDGYEPYVVIPWCPSTMINHDTHGLQEESRRDSIQRKKRNLLRQRMLQDQMSSSNPWKPMSPYYDERFHGYGKNKVQHIIHLSSAGFEFAVIPTLGFLTHYPHARSKIRKIFDKSHETLRKEMGDLIKVFKKEIIKKYITRGDHDIWTGVCKVKKRI